MIKAKAINSYLALKTAPSLPSKLPGNPSVPKNSTQEQEEYSDMEVQWNTENVLNLNLNLNLNVDSTYLQCANNLYANRNLRFYK